MTMMAEEEAAVLFGMPPSRYRQLLGGGNCKGNGPNCGTK